jgi:hypothetical protein
MTQGRDVSKVADLSNEQERARGALTPALSQREREELPDA